jgi:hypothetical protein
MITRLQGRGGHTRVSVGPNLRKRDEEATETPGTWRDISASEVARSRELTIPDRRKMKQVTIQRVDHAGIGLCYVRGPAGIIVELAETIS